MAQELPKSQKELIWAKMMGQVAQKQRSLKEGGGEAEGMSGDEYWPVRH
jgi:hypothetical protein